jgi:flagellar biosynthesis protein FlhF
MTTRTYRGRSLEELLPRVRAELGPDAVIVRQREGLMGGVGGFFQKRCVEVEAVAPEGAGTPGGIAPGEPAPGGFAVDVRSDDPATPDFLEQLRGAQSRAEDFGKPSGDAGQADPFGVGAAFGAAADDPFAAADADPFAANDAAFGAGAFVAEDFAERVDLPSTLDDDAWSDWAADNIPPGPAPAHPPVVVEEVAEVPWPQEAREPEVNPFAAPQLPAVRAPQPPLPAPLPAEIVPLRDTLVAHGLEAPIADAVVEDAVTHVLPFAAENAKPRAVLAEALARRIPVKPVGGAPGRVIAFVGPGGSGKTHLAGHLAGTYARSTGLPVACVAVRPADAGAELALLLSPAGVPMQVAGDAATAGSHVAGRRDQALVLVDTPAVSPRDRAGLRTLAGELRATGADEVVLAVPATMSVGAARELVAAGKRVGASALALTHADETEHIGPAIGVAMESGLPFAFVGQAPNGRPAVRPASAGDLAKSLLASSGR